MKRQSTSSLTHKVYFISPPRYLHDTFENTLTAYLAVAEVIVTLDVSIYLMAFIIYRVRNLWVKQSDFSGSRFLVRCPGTKAVATKTDVGFLQLFRYL